MRLKNELLGDKKGAIEEAHYHPKFWSFSFSQNLTKKAHTKTKLQWHQLILTTLQELTHNCQAVHKIVGSWTPVQVQQQSKLLTIRDL